MYLKLKKSYFDVLDRFTPFLIIMTIVSFIIGSYFALYGSPPDYIQGDSMRIMYVHVPSAWWALMSYSVLAVSCTIWFITRNPFFNLIAKSIAPIGAVFTLIALVTGSIWGQAYLGCMVGLGCKTYIYVIVIFFVPRLYFFVASNFQ